MIAQEFPNAPDMIGQATDHGRGEQNLSPFALSLSSSSAQLMMRPAEIVGTAKQPHAAFQRRQAPGRMPTLARQAGESLADCPVQALNKGRIEHCSSIRSRQQRLRLCQRSLNHLARDFHHAFLFRAFDHHRNT